MDKIGALQAALIYGLIRHFENDPTFDTAVMFSMEVRAHIPLAFITLRS